MSAGTIPLNDGTQVVVRPVRTGDAFPLLDMHHRLSPNSVRFRYLFRSYTPTLADMQRVCQVREEEGTAFVAATSFPEETIVGLAHYVIDDKHLPVTAEFAMLVEDRFQGQGLGRRLFQRLSQQAIAQGIHALNAYVHLDNQRMMHLIRKSGFAHEEKIAYGTREVQILLDPVRQHSLRPVHSFSAQ